MMNYKIILSILTSAFIAGSCVDAFEPPLKATVDVVVVDATLTNLDEPQLIRLNRSKADPVSRLFGSTPLKQATVAIVVNDNQVIYFKETEPGRYEGPANFHGIVGQRYQLRIWLISGQFYESDQEVLPPPVAINQLTEEFDLQGLPQYKVDGAVNGFRGANSLFVDFIDPPAQRNYYRWEWRLWEKKQYCCSCTQSFYSVNTITNPNIYLIGSNQCYSTNDKPYEACFYPPPAPYGPIKLPYFDYDYRCRTRCWEILYSYELNLFDDRFSNGGKITHRPVAQIPYYQPEGALAELRQNSLTAGAYAYFQQLQQQTQNTGGVADTAPALPIGNVHNVNNPDEIVVGYFSAVGATAQRHWIDRKANTGPYPGLFQGVNGRDPVEEPSLSPLFCANKPFTMLRDERPPTAICSPTDERTPSQPLGWRE